MDTTNKLLCDEETESAVSTVEPQTTDEVKNIYENKRWQNAGKTKTAYFKRMYLAHEEIGDIKRRIRDLQISAGSLAYNDKQIIKTEIEKIQETANALLKKRAEFDLFLCQLPLDYLSIINLRCRDELSWKEVADRLKISPDTTRHKYGHICYLADKKGLFNE